MSKATEAIALQRKIFSRWVNQKLQAKGKKITDCVKDLQNGDNLIYLLEALSEKQFQNWKKIQTGSRMKQIDACGQALVFLKECGVDMKTPPSSENLVDGEQVSVMGMVWAIMLKFMKLDDGEEDGPSVTFADALKMWIANQVGSYGLKVDNWTKSFHDGKVFCALVNKYRPKLLNWEQVSGNSANNLTMVFKAAETYFGLEQYLAVTDIEKLDDKSMVVYASEYYYGIAQQRKVDLAAKRVAKLIDYTKENDRLKEDYTKRAQALRARLDSNIPLLSDTTIENTMAGAVRRLELFNQYRKNEKPYLFSESFAVDSCFQNLARRLMSRKRPAFVPTKGCSVPEIHANIKEVEKKEASQNVALHEELNRQIKLAKIYEQFTGRLNELNAWVAVQRQYLDAPTDILSVAAANFALNQLEAFFTSLSSTSATLPAFHEWAKELLENKFEHSAVVNANQASVTNDFKELEEKSQKKKLKHEDDLAREIVKAHIRGLNDDHVTAFDKLNKFMASAKTALSHKEEVKSIKDAEYHLGLTRALHQHRADLTGNIEPLKKMGKEINTTEYKSSLSTWKFEHPADVSGRETQVESGFAELEALGAEKLRVLDDDLKREQFREEVRQWFENHKLQDKALVAWIAKARAYLAVKEKVDSVENAQDNLVVHRGYMDTEKATQGNDVVALLAQGKKILDAKYETKYSKYVFEPPSEVKDRETAVLNAFTELNAASALKLEILEDDLKREDYRFMVNKWAEQHVRQHKALEAWIATSKAYVDTQEPVCSVETAQNNLIVIRAYLASQTLKQDGEVKGLLGLGARILAAKYESKHSNWKFLTPQDVTSRETFVTTSFDYLTKTSQSKLDTLEDDLKREEFKFMLHLWDDEHKHKYAKLQKWIDTHKAYLGVIEIFDSIADAEKNLKAWAAKVDEMKDKTRIEAATFHKLGKQILEAKYESKLSHWEWEQKPEVQGRLDFATKSWQEMDASSAAKKTKLDADLQKEKRKEELRVQWAKLTGEAASTCRDACVSAPNTMFGFVLEEVEAFQATLVALDAKINAHVNNLESKYSPVWAEMIQLGVRTAENPYSKLTPDHMASSRAELATALAARQARFQVELEKQRADDKACRALAAAADPFAKKIADNTLTISEAKDTLEKQLETVKTLKTHPTCDELKAISAAQKVVDERAIIYNRHTLNNAPDCEVQHKQYQEYTKSKQEMLEGEIEFLALRGLTREQYVEIKQQFDQFDKDKSGFLDKREFRSCLYSVGEERGKKEIDAILAKVGNGDPNKVKISYDGYKEFMIEQLGDTDTEAELIKGFQLMNRQETTCQWTVMQNVMEQHHLDYIKATHGTDYTGWVKSVFAR
jgi:Ca2+-binding EF-hand superfamily protein